MRVITQCDLWKKLHLLVFIPAVWIREKSYSERSYLIYVMRYAIWYHLCNLKNGKNTHGGVLLLVKLQPFSLFFTPPWVFFTFFMIYNGIRRQKNVHLALDAKFENTLIYKHCSWKKTFFIQIWAFKLP